MDAKSVIQDEEYFEILYELQNHHALFGEFWNVGLVEETTEIPTAAIEFDETGTGIRFLINPEFWSTLSKREKMFVLCHECLHVYFGHGRRGINLDNKEVVNIAGDVVINHYLLDAFGFKREELKFEVLGEKTRPDGTVAKGVDNLCWMDSTFYDDPTVEPRRSMEHYYNIIMQKSKDEGAPDWVQTLDDHSGMNGQTNGKGQTPQEQAKQEKQEAEAATEFVKEVMRRLSDEELDEFEDKVEGGNPDEASQSQKAGNFAGNMSKVIRLGKVKKKKKWETVVEDVLGRFKGREKDITIEQWARQNRRMSSIGGDLMLPSEINEIMQVRDRIDVWFFQDTSGSCISYAERFFKAAASIPEDRFKIRGFCFDTKTYEVDFRKNKLKGFGGTAFHIIEEEIQRRVKEEGCAYPQAVFVITDGYGNRVNPQFPERWHWFMTDDKGSWGCTKQYIPAGSYEYSLSKFE